MALEKSEQKRLKGLAHSLKPIGQVGKNGMTEEVAKSLADALRTKELIKVKFLENAFFDKKEDPAKLAKSLEAEVIGVIGFNVILYKFNKELTKHV